MIAIRIGGSGGAALLLIVDLLKIGVNDLVVARSTTGTAVAATGPTGTGSGAAAAPVIRA